MNIFRIGPYKLDASRKVLTYASKPMALGSKTVEILAALVEAGGEVVTKDELLERVWPEGFVEEANLSQNVYMLRRALREHWDQDVIATVHGRGYRLVAQAEPLQSQIESVQPKAKSSLAPKLLLPLSLAGTAGVAIFLAAVLSHQRVDHPSLSPQGQQYYKVAQYYLNQRKLFESRRYFARLTTSDPNSAVGYAGLAETFALMPDFSVRRPSPDTAIQRAWTYATKAIRLDAKSADANAALGFLKNERSGDAAAGEPELRRAVALDPTDSLAREWLGISLFEQGHIREAETQLRTAERLNPVSSIGETWLGSVLFMERRYHEAIDHLQRAIDLDPGSQRAYEQLARAYEEIGDYKSALASLDHFAKICACPPRAAAMRAQAFARMGNFSEARSALLFAATSQSPPLDVAFAYLALGDRKDALSWLHRVHLRDPRESALLAHDPRLDPVRDDWRFNLWTHPAATSNDS